MQAFAPFEADLLLVREYDQARTSCDQRSARLEARLERGAPALRRYGPGCGPDRDKKELCASDFCALECDAFDVRPGRDWIELRVGAD